MNKCSITDVPRSLVVLWQRMGPYHLARLRGAQEVLGKSGIDVLGLEASHEDEYAWTAHEDASVRIVTACPNRSYNELRRPALQRRITLALDEIQPLVVAVNGWSVPEARAAIRWCRLRKVPAILMSETHEPSPRHWKELVKRWRVRGFSAAVVGGSWHADYLAGLGFPRDRIFVGYDAVDNMHFSKHVRDPTCTTIPAQPYFFANTRFLKRKNVDGLLHAFRVYLTYCTECSRLPWNLVVSGSGEEEASWKQLTTRLGLDKYVNWPGFLQYQQLPAWYQRAGCFVHVAHREAWGLVVNEACAAGRPIIASNRVGSTCELVREGQNGWLVESSDTEAIARAMIHVTGLSEEERSVKGQASKALVSTFSPEGFGIALENAVKVATRF